MSVVFKKCNTRVNLKSWWFTSNGIRCEFESCSGEVNSIQHNVIKFVSQLLTTVLWISPGTPVSSTDKTDRHDITDILLKVVLNTITLVRCVCCVQEI